MLSTEPLDFPGEPANKPSERYQKRHQPVVTAQPSKRQCIVPSIMVRRFEGVYFVGIFLPMS